jgi:hypothetical protein
MEPSGPNPGEIRGARGRTRPPDYDGLATWQLGDTIAVATYAALFNSNPRFTAPQALILDDAHAAEDYVASR